MKQKYSVSLAKIVLEIIGSPIPKVRLAKLVYFAFKELVSANVVNIQDMSFVRMPLGPVPHGLFPNIDIDSEVKISITNVGLSYNRQSYSLLNLKKNNIIFEETRILKDRLAIINGYPTSTLVECSHNDDSWKSHINGDTYCISKLDINNNQFAINASLKDEIDSTLDDQLVQSKLVDGMIDDIVKDSSSLEFPDKYVN